MSGTPQAMCPPESRSSYVAIGFVVKHHKGWFPVTCIFYLGINPRILNGQRTSEFWTSFKTLWLLATNVHPCPSRQKVTSRRGSAAEKRLRHQEIWQHCPQRQVVMSVVSHRNCSWLLSLFYASQNTRWKTRENTNYIDIPTNITNIIKYLHQNHQVF